MEKLALAIHDLSSYSKSSLTVVLPVLEALKVETAVLPTALLSTQTDGFTSFFIKDNTEVMEKILDEYEKLSLRFDGVYSGFLYNQSQIEIVKKASSLSPLLFVDPVMGDNGLLYSTMDKSYVNAMRSLVEMADIITPNYTEAVLLTSSEFKSELTMGDVNDLVGDLRKLGPKKGVITSVPLSLGQLVNVSYSDSETRLFSFENEGISFPGAGDLFASVLFSLTVREMAFFESALIATSISSKAVSQSRKENRERRRGISLESVIDEIKRIRI